MNLSELFTEFVEVLGLPISLILTGLFIRSFPYDGYKPLDDPQRYISRHGINLSFLDLSKEQWEYMSNKLAPKLFLISGIIDASICILLNVFLSNFNLSVALIIYIVFLLSTLFYCVLKAEKYDGSKH